MIALLKGGEYYLYYPFPNDIKGFLMEYTEYIGLDTRIFRILASSNEMEIKELIDYINKNCYDWEQEIVSIHELGNQVY